ncbi:MAG: energy transducer TonB [Acidobacteria bacterium]|nr:energy transducer TonB [Acidobacteriota bacterium]
MNRKLGDLNIADSATAVAPPKLEVPVQRASGAESAAKPEAPAAPDIQGIAASGANATGQLIALNVRPQAPTASIQSPGGNRSGIFAATPEGKPGAPGTPDIVAGHEGAGGSGGDMNSNTVPAGIYVGAPPAQPAAVAGKPGLSADQQKRILVANMMHTAPLSNTVRATPPPTIDAPRGKVEDEVFGPKKVYSMIMNMPNLTSGGGSWIVRYAELQQHPGGDELTAPVAVQKADPAYPAEAIREHVEGTVVLYAIIHSDGRVTDVRVLRSVDERLDASAQTALAHWQFRPATKGGTPVALETVVHIPFTVPKNGF